MKYIDHSEEYFYSMVTPRAKVVRRVCLKCRKEFKSIAGRRTCGVCAAGNSRLAKNAMEIR